MPLNVFTHFSVQDLKAAQTLHMNPKAKKLSQMIDQMEIKTEIDTIMMLGALGVNDRVSEWYL